MTEEVKSYNVDSETRVSIPIRNIVGMIVFTAVSVLGYTNLLSQISDLEHRSILMQRDVDNNSEFRIRWPRGEMGSLPADAEQDMRIEFMSAELQYFKTYEQRFQNLESRMGLLLTPDNNIVPSPDVFATRQALKDELQAQIRDLQIRMAILEKEDAHPPK